MLDETKKTGTDDSWDDVEDATPKQAPPVIESQDEVPATPPAKRVFSKGDIKRAITILLHMPLLYEGFEPWAFQLRLKLSKDAEEARQEYLALAQADQTTKANEQNLNELCDLMTKLPTGFSDLTPVDGERPGDTFKRYVAESDGATRDMLDNIVSGVLFSYNRKLTPLEFRK